MSIIYDPKKIIIPISTIKKKDNWFTRKYYTTYKKLEEKIRYTFEMLPPCTQEEVDHYCSCLNDEPWGYNPEKAAREILYDIMAGMEIELMEEDVDGFRGSILFDRKPIKKRIFKRDISESELLMYMPRDKMARRNKLWEGFLYENKDGLFATRADTIPREILEKYKVESN